MSFEPATVEQHIENWRAGLRRDSERLGVDKHTTDLIIAATEASVRSQIDWLKCVVEPSIPRSLEHVDMDAFCNTMLGVAYRQPVYLVEAHTFPDAFFRANGSPVHTDGADTFESARRMVFSAFDENVSHIFITRDGERKRVDSCAQFMVEYSPQ